MRFLPLALLVLLTAGQAFARSGGDWSSAGGGSGVACFAEVADAVRAESFIASGKILPADLLGRARLRVLEAWEMEATKQKVLKVDASEDWQAAHRRVRGMIARALPLFASRLEIAGSWADFSRWEVDTDLSLIDDANPMAPLPENCRRLQLVARYSNGNQPGTLPLGAIQVKVVFNKVYFDLLPVLDQAMLVLHEELYIMGQAIGHANSDFIRAMVRIFFLEDIFEADSGGYPDFLIRGEGHALFKTYLIEHFGDYVHYFSALNRPLDTALHTADHHLSTFKNFNLRKRELMGACREAGGEFYACTEKIMNPSAVAHELNDEEAFLYLAHFWLDRSVKIFNFDYLVVKEVGDQNFKNAMAFSCFHIGMMKKGYVIQSIQDKAVRYCNTWQAAN